MNLRSFFRVTGLLLDRRRRGSVRVLAPRAPGGGLAPVLDTHAFDLSSNLPDDAGPGAILRGLVGYNADPTWLEVVGWAAYLVVVGGLFLRAPKLPGIEVSTRTRDFVDGPRPMWRPTLARCDHPSVVRVTLLPCPRPAAMETRPCATQALAAIIGLTSLNLPFTVRDGSQRDASPERFRPIEVAVRRDRV